MLGYVAEPAPGHEERFTGMLSIPYITPLGGVVAFKFRSLDPTVDKRYRYNSPTGQAHHLFNVNALVDAVDSILIVEGELDAIAATLAGFPAVAVPGVNGWKKHFRRCFDGVDKVIVVTDNDVEKEDGSNPGRELAVKLMRELHQSVRVSLPTGHDVNSTILSYGADHFAALVGAVK
jgi:DNA primase